MATVIGEINAHNLDEVVQELRRFTQSLKSPQAREFLTTACERIRSAWDVEQTQYGNVGQAMTETLYSSRPGSGGQNR